MAAPTEKDVLDPGCLPSSDQLHSTPATAAKTRAAKKHLLKKASRDRLKEWDKEDEEDDMEGSDTNSMLAFDTSSDDDDYCPSPQKSRHRGRWRSSSSPAAAAKAQAARKRPLERVTEDVLEWDEEDKEGDMEGSDNNSELSFEMETSSDDDCFHLRSRPRGRQRSSTHRSRSPVQAWKTEEEPDVAPPELKFSPRRKPGVQPPLDVGKPTPIDIFSSFFDSEVLNLLCTNTNKNAAVNIAKGQKCAWRDIGTEDLKKYIGLLLYMGVMSLPKMSDFWRQKTIFKIPFPSSVMSRDRFRTISRFLHINDPIADAKNDQAKGTKDYDCLHRVRPLLDMMRARCMDAYHPRQHIAVDERMVATKARLAIKQYMKNKPTKWGLKFFVMADTNGYTVDYRLYTGRSIGNSGNGLSFDVVTTLVNKDYLGTGYIIYCDNYYTSPVLFRHLGQQGFGACGTYRQVRTDVPHTEENALTKNSPRGSIRWIRDKDLLFVKWMDTREVSLCTNVHSVYSGETVMRWRKKIDGTFEKLPVPRPTVVGEYNRYMGGVDTSDQMLKTGSVYRRTKRWYMRVFQHLLDMAVTNSFIMMKELSTIQHERPPTRQDFQELLSAQLLGVRLKARPQERIHTHDHFPVPNRKVEDPSKRASLGRRSCTMCKRSTPWQCERCKVGLCLQLDRNCFKAFHDGS